MNYTKVIKKLVKKANDNIEQQCGIRPFKIPYHLFDIFEDEELFKSAFGFATSLETSIDRTLYPAWGYHFKITNRIRYSGFNGIDKAFQYLEKLV